MTMKQSLFWLVLSWLAVGATLSGLSLLGWLQPGLVWLICVPWICLLVVMVNGVRSFFSFSVGEKVLTLGLVGMWCLHLTGVFVPETGFDAVWYHLPVAQAMLAAHGVIHVPDLYQSLNPLFSDVLFMAGFGLGQEFGAKLVAFSISLSLLLVVYQLSRLKLTRFWSLLLMLTVSSFQVISWQASSFYVDSAKALWEVTALWWLFDPVLPLKKYRYGMVGIAVGATLATKAFSWLLLPVFIGLIWFKRPQAVSRKIGVFGLMTLAIGLPYYLRTWLETGNPVLTISLHLNKLSEIGGESSWLLFMGERTMSLPWSIFQLTFFSSDYVSLLLLVFSPLLIFTFRQWRRDRQLINWIGFGMIQYAAWWWLPPTSTRYSLSGFIVWMIVLFWAAEKTTEEKPTYFKPLLLTIGLALLINMVPRIWVAKRNLDYILVQPEREIYLEQFYDGAIDTHLKKWYRLPA